MSLLRQIEVGVATWKTTVQACKDAMITEQTYYRWRKEFGGLQVDQARQSNLPGLLKVRQVRRRVLTSTSASGLFIFCSTLSEVQRDESAKTLRRLVRSVDS